VSGHLRVAVVHPHLRPGGVTKVVETSLRALAEHPIRVAVLSGSPVGPNFPAPVGLVEGLDYLDGPATRPKALADALEQQAADALGAPPDLWHVHNPVVGRHPVFALAVAALVRRGHRLLLHVHDFPEDGRPANYAALREAGALPSLYPDVSHVHYALLTRHDRGILMGAGLPGDRLHVLPNAVETDVAAPPAPPDDGPPLLLYPTRAIRRKNLGEMLLWGARMGGDARWAVTLAPTNPSDLEPYRKWKALAAELELPVEFEAGLRAPDAYETLLARSTAVVTTSVAEGFGLAYLEAATRRRPLLGRDLPVVTGDLTCDGLRFPGLYDRCGVPLGWFGADRIRNALFSGWAEVLAAYDRLPAPDDEARLMNAAITGDEVDMGCLDESMQREAVRSARSSTGGHSLLTALPAAAAVMPGNLVRIRDHYGLERYGARLMALYRAVAGAPADGPAWADPTRVLDAFLEPARFTLLRT
jgi:glycosyltransferase involved in cell wall biosynthesis